MRTSKDLHCFECGLVLEPGVPAACDRAGRLFCEYETAKLSEPTMRVGWLHIACGGTGDVEGSRCLACEGTGVECKSYND